MNDSKTIEDLSKEVSELRSRLNTVICVLVVLVVLSLITFLQSIFSTILSNPLLQFMTIIVIGMASFVAVLIFIDIRLYREQMKS